MKSFPGFNFPPLTEKIALCSNNVGCVGGKETQWHMIREVQLEHLTTVCNIWTGFRLESYHSCDYFIFCHNFSCYKLICQECVLACIWLANTVPHRMISRCSRSSNFFCQMKLLLCWHPHCVTAVLNGLNVAWGKATSSQQHIFSPGIWQVWIYYIYAT